MALILRILLANSNFLRKSSFKYVKLEIILVSRIFFWANFIKMKLKYFLKSLEQNRKLSLTLSSNFPPNSGDSVFSKARVKYQFFSGNKGESKKNNGFHIK